jgi:Uma2 family endonuclease
MRWNTAEMQEPGPFRADQIREGDRYELSNGDPIRCAPAGADHAAPNLTGGSVLETDPAVEWAGVDPGYSPHPGMLRAPDVAIGAKTTGRGWIPGAPPFAVEYAGASQDEEKLQQKIADLLGAGTQLIWVARLVGPLRVEVYEPGKPVRTVPVGSDLHAPGFLKNPVPVRALFDRDAAHEATLRNLLQRRGYEGLDAIRAEGEARGLVEGILAVLAARGLAVDDEQRAQISACADVATLRRWLARAAQVERAADLVADR